MTANIRNTSADPVGSRPLLTTAGTAAHYGIPKKLLERYRLEGGGPRYVKLARRVLYRPEDIDAWLVGRTVSDTADARHRLGASAER